MWSRSRRASSRLGDARQRPTLLGLARREHKEEAGTSAFRLFRRDFLGSRIRSLLAHSKTRNGRNVSARDLARKTQRISQQRKSNSNRPTRKTDKKNTEGIRREFRRHISRKSPTRNNKKSRKNSGENNFFTAVIVAEVNSVSDNLFTAMIVAEVNASSWLAESTRYKTRADLLLSD